MWPCGRVARCTHIRGSYPAGTPNPLDNIYYKEGASRKWFFINYWEGSPIRKGMSLWFGKQGPVWADQMGSCEYLPSKNDYPYQISLFVTIKSDQYQLTHYKGKPQNYLKPWLYGVKLDCYECKRWPKYDAETDCKGYWFLEGVWHHKTINQFEGNYTVWQAFRTHIFTKVEVPIKLLVLSA